MSMNKLTPEDIPGDAFIYKNGEQEGPYSVDQINELLSKGQVQWSDLVWVEGWPEWKQLSSLVLPPLPVKPPPFPIAISKPEAKISPRPSALGKRPKSRINGKYVVSMGDDDAEAENVRLWNEKLANDPPQDLNEAFDRLCSSDQTENVTSYAKTVCGLKEANPRADAQESKGNRDNIEQDYTREFISYQKAADQGDADAQCRIGSMYDYGRGVVQDYNQAFSWYLKAANQGHAEAQKNIGVMYGDGLGVTQDHSQALSWLQKAADQSHADAQFNIGVMYLQSLGVTQDYSQALRWFRLAADQGMAEAQCLVGHMYFFGHGVAQDYNQAMFWLQKAADQGNASAQFSVGAMYQRGLGVRTDYSQALRWYRKAAEQGYHAAQCRLGMMNLEGQGVTQDIAKAKEWLQKAAEQGDSDAMEALQRLP